MAENLSRFVIIDGVQIEKTRAKRLGYIDDNDKIVKRKAKVVVADVDDDQPGLEPTAVVEQAPAEDVPVASAAPSVDEPTSRRARGSETARRG